MSLNRSRIRTTVGAAVACAAAAAAGVLAPAPASATSAALPPVHAGFDYQIGGAYTPPSGVRVVSRDHSASPAPGLYNICYVNAFQTQKTGQPGGPDDWPSDLLLKNDDGDVIIDTDWDEAILDITTEKKREGIAERIDAQIDECAAKGFNALELDNFDTFTRDVVEGRITEEHAQTYIRMLSAYGHGKGLAVGQKNTVELAGNHAANGLDFAIAEECGNPDYNECADYVAEFGDHAIFIEYTNAGMKNACEYGDRVSVVQRDRDVLPKGEDGYVRKTCP
ncbi:endo alpha-1,4 polygalactosaminidase [Streptomyces yatensis]|uniref:Endo alpha-1,4 polygalactosaminidase n=1 Tax=Streptomyces yatensis TaxID=155177 RepID=A0ABN2JNQ4_9ACTN|nr:endo alpha-1,4 polygalactosaminidase [Streptomyces yatensis]